MTNTNIRIRMAQLNYKIADFNSNGDKILAAIAASADADLLVFSELALSGYAPLDLVFEPWFLPRQEAALKKILQASVNFNGMIAVGLVRELRSPGKPLANSLAIIEHGEIISIYDKQLLPTYDVFDERRYFEPGKNPAVIVDIKGVAVGFIICEDGWNDRGEDYAANPIQQAVSLGAKLIVSLNASPSSLGKQHYRQRMFSEIASRYQVPLIYVNQVGGNDQVVYDGASFVTAKGQFLQADSFREVIACVDIKQGEIAGSEDLYAPCAMTDVAFQYQQIQLGLKDYLAKTGFRKVIVGSSGGIDSAVTIALAAAALGADNVEAVTMPSRYSSTGSVSDSELLCNNLGVVLRCHSIKDIVEAECDAYADAFGESPSGLALENLQARIRGLILMTRSNQSGAMLLTTGNKSELSVGYATLYGDMSGGLNLIGDLYKTEVYALAEYINQLAGTAVIPVDIITKPPSAELAPGQRDDDSLPPYPVLDAMLMVLIERSNTPFDALSSLTAETLEALRVRIATMLARAEFKRKQAPPVIRCRALAFGSGRQMPIACVGH